MKQKTGLLFGFLFLAMAIAVSGCGRDSDAVVVDFTKTIAVERPASQIPEAATFNVAVAAMISPKETFGYYRQLLDYIGEQLGREVQFIQRKTYSEINELLGIGQIDLAFICSGPYAAGKEIYDFELIATPQVQKSHFYQSYLIVNKASQFNRYRRLERACFCLHRSGLQYRQAGTDLLAFRNGRTTGNILQQNDLYLQP